MMFWVINRNSATKYLSFNYYFILLEIAGVDSLEHFQCNLGYVDNAIIVVSTQVLNNLWMWKSSLGWFKVPVLVYLQIYTLDIRAIYMYCIFVANHLDTDDVINNSNKNIVYVCCMYWVNMQSIGLFGFIMVISCLIKFTGLEF